MLEKFDFLGVGFKLTNQQNALKLVVDLRGPGYVCFPDASVVVMANKDPQLMRILNSSMITFPDGKPSEIVARLRGHKNVSTVSGFHLCREILSTDKSHYFYGADDATLQSLISQITREFPTAVIKGAKSPPYIHQMDIATSIEIEKDIIEIESLSPDFVWIGVSSPKQDYIMHHFHHMLPRSIMIGVGGVFLYLANPEMKSPEWIKKIGMRWLYRLAKEPSRLGSKYMDTLAFLIKNSSYFLKLALKKK